LHGEGEDIEMEMQEARYNMADQLEDYRAYEVKDQEEKQ
jgi:hypothetical protein